MVTEGKKRVRKSPEERKREIIAAAGKLIGEKGYYGTSLKDIADAIGMSQPGLLHYIGNKERLLSLLVTDSYDQQGTPADFAAPSEAAASADPSAGAASPEPASPTPEPAAETPAAAPAAKRGCFFITVTSFSLSQIITNFPAYRNDVPKKFTLASAAHSRYSNSIP